MPSEHRRPGGGLAQGYYCCNCGAGGMSLYGGPHYVSKWTHGHYVGKRKYTCESNPELVEEVKKANLPPTEGEIGLGGLPRGSLNVLMSEPGRARSSLRYWPTPAKATETVKKAPEDYEDILDLLQTVEELYEDVTDDGEGEVPLAEHMNKIYNFLKDRAAAQPEAQPAELLQCPFCDGEGIPVAVPVKTLSGNDADNCYIRCRSCACEGGWSKTAAGARRLWNTRTSYGNRYRDEFRHRFVKSDPVTNMCCHLPEFDPIHKVSPDVRYKEEISWASTRSWNEE